MPNLAIVGANPLENFQVLYGTEALKLNENNEVVRVGGIAYTIKDGIVYDAKKLFAEIGGMSETNGRPQEQTGGPFATPLGPQISSLASSF